MTAEEKSKHQPVIVTGSVHTAASPSTIKTSVDPQDAVGELVGDNNSDLSAQDCYQQHDESPTVDEPCIKVCMCDIQTAWLKCHS